LPPSLTRSGKSPNAPAEIRCCLSVLIVSFNTREVLRRCLKALEAEGAWLRGEQLGLEIIVADNGSSDGSELMLSREFRDVRLIRVGRNIGFAAANNLMFAEARGQYIILLNSDAFLCPGALKRALEHMESMPEAGMGGARLIGEDGGWQPSARQFPCLLNDFLSLSGLAHRFRTSGFWGRADRTWADPMEPSDTDWVPGAFSIIRASVIRQVGGFDETFFLYYEEVDLCRRIKAAGYLVRYWPDVVVVHLGGESSKNMPQAVRSKSGSQLTLWRLRSGFLYYRKHHGSAAWRVFTLERGWHALRFVRNIVSPRRARREKAAESQVMMALTRRAWDDTSGGRVSPPRPW
jgi:GT2 family glycosyltransferase